MKRHARRTFQPQAEPVEGRLLLTAGLRSLALGPNGFLYNPPGFAVVRPNTPVLPFGSPLANASFIDPTALVTNGKHVVMGHKSYVGPYVQLDGRTGFVKIGSGSAIEDNATVVATAPANLRNPASVLIGDFVNVGYGATVNGPSVIGAYGAGSKPTGIGPNALIDGATIQQGAVVGALARVGPGVTVPTGFYVLPGANVTTNAEASNPAFGKVAALPAGVFADLNTEIARDIALAAGFTNLYQGASATGASPGVDSSVTGVNNGNLAAVLGTSQEPGAATSTAATGVTFEPTKRGPKFPGPHQFQVEGDLPGFRGRVVGDARFGVRAGVVQAGLGKHNSIRADQGQPISFTGVLDTGRGVTINAPLGGIVTTGSTKTVGGISFGKDFAAGNGVVVLGGTSASGYAIGSNVSIDSGSVVERSNLGNGTRVGARSVVIDSTLPAGSVVAPGSVIIKNVVTGRVGW